MSFSPWPIRHRAGDWIFSLDVAKGDNYAQDSIDKKNTMRKGGGEYDRQDDR
jgi:hypothetical protein